MFKRMIVVILALLCLVGWGDANAQTGQRTFGRASVEPAVNDANGNLIFLLTPIKVAIPAVSNPQAAAPLYLPIYPTSSTVPADTFHCQPNNCDHLNVLPFPTAGYTNGGDTCIQYGLAANSCSLVKGHDHLAGVPHTGDFNVAWHVILVVFTQAGIDAGAANHRNLTLQDVATLVTNGWAFEASTPITFNCSIVPANIYYKGVPQFF